MYLLTRYMPKSYRYETMFFRLYILYFMTSTVYVTCAICVSKRFNKKCNYRNICYDPKCDPLSK